jgi:nuclease HARBI1
MTIYLRRNNAGAFPKLRKVAKLIKVRDRLYGLKLQEIRRIRRLKRRILMVSFLLTNPSVGTTVDEVEALARLLISYIFEYIEIRLYYPDPPIDHIVHANLNIEFFEAHPSLSWRMLRFDAIHLRRLFQGLRIPVGYITLVNHSRIRSEELFIFSLYRLAKAPTLEDASTIFGFENTQLSRAFQWFIHHIITNFEYLLNDSIIQWIDLFPVFAERIEEKMNSLGVHFNGEQRNGIACFIDATFLKTCRPSGPYNVQRSFFSRYRKCTGIKIQAITFPNGIIGEAWGPASGRRNDRFLLRNSMVNERLAETQDGRPAQYLCYGDGLYLVLSHLRRRHIGPHLSAQQTLQNRTMSKLRIAIEWCFQKLKRLWKFIVTPDNNKLRGRGLASVSDVLKVAIILTNCHTCLYGSLTNFYFNMEAPTLEEYLNNQLHEDDDEEEDE